MNRGAMPPPSFGNDHLRVPKPKSLKEVPDYLKKLLSGFFSRLFYIYGIVWQTRPWILFAMLFMSVFHGVIPIIGA